MVVVEVVVVVDDGGGCCCCVESCAYPFVVVAGVDGVDMNVAVQRN